LLSEKEAFRYIKIFESKVDYINKTNHILFNRYLSHKFHGKGPGKNKIEKRIKKAEQEAVIINFYSEVSFSL